MLDPNIRPELVTNAGEHRDRLDSVIARSTIVKASDADLAWLYPDLDLEAAVDRTLTGGVRLVVATLGAQGAFGASDGVRVRVSAPRVEVVDTIGAGDSFGAAFLAWLHDHGALGMDVSLGANELESALDFACLAASVTCTRAGAEPPWRAELGDDRADSPGTSYT
jgi:fructokinase